MVLDGFPTRLLRFSPRPATGRPFALLTLGNRATATLALFFACCVISPVYCQPPPATGQSAIPPVETMTLTTKDDVSLSCSYYPGTKGKQTVPIILLHGWEGPRGAGSGKDCAPLAIRLQQQGHAVIVPDLRGHGQSTRRVRADRSDERIERDSLRPNDFREMQNDVEAVKMFLMEQNNAGKLNIELLCVIGFDLGAVVGMNWVQYDWSIAPLPTLKQGQDVKAFVLISPEQTFKGLAITPALRDANVRGELSCLIAFGTQSSSSATAGRRLYNTLKRSHRPIPETEEERQQKQDLFLVELDTSLQGTKLLAAPALGLADEIERFIRWRLVNRQGSFPWTDRTRP